MCTSIKRTHVRFMTWEESERGKWRLSRSAVRARVRRTTAADGGGPARKPRRAVVGTEKPKSKKKTKTKQKTGRHRHRHPVLVGKSRARARACGERCAYTLPSPLPRTTHPRPSACFHSRERKVCVRVRATTTGGLRCVGAGGRRARSLYPGDGE